MKAAYIDCFSGISGDMFLAGLIDAGLPVDLLNDQLHRLHLPEVFSVKSKKVQKVAVQATLLEMDIQEHEHGHGHHHRHLSEIRALIEMSGLSQKVIGTALEIFEKLAQAEGEIHGVPPEEVHFHEVGATDSILDIVGAAIGLEYLAIERLYSSAVPLGSGKVTTQHGILPLPAPATMKLLVSAGAKVVPSASEIELVTPTGAAILASLATFEQPSMQLLQVGTGAGRKDLPWPNILRVVIGEMGAEIGPQTLVIDTNIDDMTPQTLGYLMERLFQAGALDVFFTPIQMKKNRPAVKLSVIARRTDEPSLAFLILQESSSFGVRVTPVHRYEAGREMRVVTTRFGDIPVKIKILEDRPVQAWPEYDACLKLAHQFGVSILEVYQEAQAQAKI